MTTGTQVMRLSEVSLGECKAEEEWSVSRVPARRVGQPPTSRTSPSPDELRFVRDEEAVGSNPATPTRKTQVRGQFPDLGDWPLDRLLADC